MVGRAPTKPYETETVQDKTVSRLHVDRRSMHVVWHHLIYSPERKHIIIQGFVIFAYYSRSGLASQCCDVVLVRVHLARENPRGSGFLNGEGMRRDGSGEISLRVTWDQGGQDPITARRVPSK